MSSWDVPQIQLCSHVVPRYVYDALIIIAFPRGGCSLRSQDGVATLHETLSLPRTCADCWDKDESFSGLGPFECPVASACRGLNTCLELDDRVAMDGPLCASCSPGRAHMSSTSVLGFQRTGPDEPCSACPPNWLTIFVILVVSLGGMLGLCVLSWSQEPRSYSYHHLSRSCAQDASLGNLRGDFAASVFAHFCSGRSNPWASAPGRSRKSIFT